jgi:hypothetical protein
VLAPLDVDLLTAVMAGKAELIRIGRLKKIPAMMVIVLMFANSAAGITFQKVLCLTEFVFVVLFQERP